jgi:hypothetical protein
MKKKSVSDPTYNKSFGRTICEVHRELYDILESELKDHHTYNDINTRLQEAYTMAKKMDAKLRQYKHNYDDNWWETEKNSVIQEKLYKRSLRDKSS